MARVRHSVATHKRKKRLLKKAKGYFLDRSKQYQQAKRTLDRALVYAYEGRKVKKRTFRSLWITRISAACREAGTTYSAFMKGLKTAKIDIDRKILAELAVSDPKAFKELLGLAAEKKK